MKRAAAFGDRCLTHLVAVLDRQSTNVPFGIAAFCLLTAFVLPWVNEPLGKDPRGFQFALFRDIPVQPHFHLGSYGIVGIALFTCAMLARLFDRRAAICGGVLLLALALAAPMQIAFSNPDILRRLASEFSQRQNVHNFTATFLPVNQGQEPNLWVSLDFDTIWSRAVTAWYFLTLGWYVFGLAALIVFFKGVLLLHRRRMRAMLLSALALGILGAIFTAQPYYANRQLNRAYLAQARGKAEKAIEFYRTTIRLDRWYALGPELYEQIGEMHETLGALDSPEYHLYKGQVFENLGAQSTAMYEYRLAARDGGDLEIVAHREAARVAANFGLTLYAQQAFGAALAEWRQAFAEDPLQLQVLFYAARAHFEVAQYRDAIAAGEQFCKRASNTYAMADVYSDMGDSYTKLDDHANARTCYELSFKLDYIINARGLGALTGN